MDERWLRAARDHVRIERRDRAIPASRRSCPRQGQLDKLADILNTLVLTLVPQHGYSRSRGYIEEGVTVSRECGHELSLVYFLSHRARLELNQGQWEDAA